MNDLIVRATVRGDCGVVHPSVADWQRCEACASAIARAMAPHRLGRAIALEQQRVRYEMQRLAMEGQR